MRRLTVVIFAALFAAGMFSMAFAQSPVAETKKETVESAGKTNKKETAKIAPGTYDQESNLEFSKEKDGFDGTGSMKMQLDLKADGTFTLVAYMTSKALALKDQLFIKLRGKWKQQGDQVLQSGLQAQYYNLDTKTMSPWAAPEDGKTTDTATVRNVTKNTFEEFDGATKQWATWTRR